MYNYPIYCINLEHRKDRKQHSFNEFMELNIPQNKVIYLPFKKDRRGGVYGCFNSHMKVWKDFFVNHPKKKFCLVCEDDFEINKNTKNIMSDAVDFINDNYTNIDILFLHNLYVTVDNNINTNKFKNGYGFGTHAYFITRNYIQSIIDKYGNLPKANGRHFDFELSINNVNEDNWLYTEKVFYTTKECIKQKVDNSDNYINYIDKVMRTNINKQLLIPKNFGNFVKKYDLLNDDQLKKFYWYMHNIL